MKEQFDLPALQSELQTLRLERDRLRESEQHYSNLVELAAIGISHVDLNGRFVHVNRRLCEMLGYTREELLELSVREISHPDDRFATDKDRAGSTPARSTRSRPRSGTCARTARRSGCT